MFSDRQLVCDECGETFVFSAAEQAFFQEKGLRNKPKRCPNCRVRARMHRKGQSKATMVNCSSCGAQTLVPFEPIGHRPIFCAACLHTIKQRAHNIDSTPHGT